MGARVNLNLPSSLWTAQDSARLALNTLAAIKLRTSKGIDANGQPFDGYSKRPIYVAYRGARLKPKGGRVSRTMTNISVRAAVMARAQARSLTSPSVASL
jgi:hypothetical protein